jgi:hypothetical protein
LNVSMGLLRSVPIGVFPVFRHEDMYLAIPLTTGPSNPLQLDSKSARARMDENSGRTSLMDCLGMS